MNLHSLRKCCVHLDSRGLVDPGPFLFPVRLFVLLVAKFTTQAVPGSKHVVSQKIKRNVYIQKWYV